MPPPTAPWTSKIFDLLADGDWHSREHVVTEAMALVPPGRAFRKGEKDRTRSNGATTARTRGDDETARRTGARQVVQDSIVGLRTRGRLQIRPCAEGDQIRLGRPPTTAELVHVGWAYRTGDRWHLCADKPSTSNGRRTVRPVYIQADTAKDGGAVG